ncbi:histidine biosynthesis bifunctional protein HisIE [Alicyclobacillus contaminans]|uniref:bifunctional phosphoribosyl-AMP cyclohydrolase/phosphoribosyl-ATP diphosphatase HisIE n=1 Tax=Alicyclobacillus contaminans TaxID=392016 RepID=UPI000408CB8D|nr:bifunctional phosphoribosyl-AMP cyclohydrolase/phosphoribosyl-ATP diphosphatase HisIE [Alicyclobacillus contaminans]GMA49658.1 histidine biosynthesis bifunctional protein HisIE [Alicyclobacillus contaminans]
MERGERGVTAALDVVRYDAATGLVPVVVQDAEDGRVLMLAYANREALKRTLATGQAWFWSRSRQAYWRKGATSGNTQQVVEVRVDCDGDAVLYRVLPNGPACHTGEDTCFYRQVDRVADVPGSMANPQATGGRTPAADAVSSSRETVETSKGNRDADSISGLLDTLADLWGVVDHRWRERPNGSYTTYLFTQGVDKAAKKLGEEAVETVIAAKNAVESAAGQAELAAESADLLYHLLVLWKTAGLSPAQVRAVLKARAQ